MSQVPRDDYRAAFTAFLRSPNTSRDADGGALRTVSLMNDRMVADGVPMTREHYDAATTSLSRGDSICGFLSTENKHVLQSTGRGATYYAGYAFHRTVVSGLNWWSGVE